MLWETRWARSPSLYIPSRSLTQPPKNDGWKTTFPWDGNSSGAMLNFHKVTRTNGREYTGFTYRGYFTPIITGDAAQP